MKKREEEEEGQRERERDKGIKRTSTDPIQTTTAVYSLTSSCTQIKSTIFQDQTSHPLSFLLEQLVVIWQSHFPFQNPAISS